MRMYTFVESPLFGKQVYKYLSDGEYVALQWSLASRPDAGDIIQGSGGFANSALQPRVRASEVA